MLVVVVVEGWWMAEAGWWMVDSGVGQRRERESNTHFAESNFGFPTVDAPRSEIRDPEVIRSSATVKKWKNRATRQAVEHH